MAYWVPSSEHADNATVGGHDVDGSPLYVGRAYHDGELVPGKVLPATRMAYVSHGGREHAKDTFEILCGGNLSWVPSADGAIPFNAVSAGRSNAGEPLYIGRGHFQGSVTPGKIHPTNGCLYIAFAGSEIPIHSYEVLTEN